jgi:ABC-2 type transport system permease protein
MMQFASEPLPVNVVIVSYDSNSFVEPNNFTQTYWDNYTTPYIDAVNESEELNLLYVYNATEEIYAMELARELLMDDEIKCIIVIPVDFSEMLIWGFPGMIEAVPDSSSIQNIQEILNAVYDSINIFVEDNNLDPQFVLQQYEEFTIPAGYDFEYNYNITMMLSFIIFGISTVLTILVVVQEKPIPRLLLTPVKKYEILLSKYLTYTLILLLQITLVLISAIGNGLYIKGNIFDLYIALFMVGFTGMTLGMFISTLSKTKTEANQLFFAFFIVIVLLSGIFIPIENMPPALQTLANILPLSHGDPMIRGIVTKGNSFLGPDFFSLLGLSIFLFAVSFILIYRTRYEV